jgi:simple sugar transport system ATP-binding protein
VALELRDVHVMGARGTPAVRGVSLAVRAGEIFGIAGVEGNGQSELIEAIVGLRPVARGGIVLRGREVTRSPVYARYRAGLAHVPEDRHDRALLLDESIRDNLILGLQREYTGRLDLLDRRRIDERAAQLVDEFDVRPPVPAHLVGGLSGGNQQKVVVARELSRRGTAVLVCAQPTRGVDIGAVQAIHRRMIQARDRGIAVLLFSAELAELQGLSDRLAVIYKGRIVSTLGGSELATQSALDRVGALMTGASSGGAA